MAGKGHPGPPLGSQNHLIHGLVRLKRAVKVLGNRVLDKRSKVGKALAAWRSELLADLGGAESISTQEAALIDAAVKTKLILDSIDAWLLTQRTLINKRQRSVIAAVQQRNALVTTLKGLLESLGLKRRTKEVPSLAEYLASKANGTTEPTPQAEVEHHHAATQPRDEEHRFAKAATDGSEKP